MLIGAHVSSQDPLGEASERMAEAVQIFASSPRSWRAPTPRDDAEDLRGSDLPIYVHTSYLVNVATVQNNIRHPSRKSLQDCLDAAAEIDAEGVVVHGGYVTGDGDFEDGLDNWRKTMERLETDVPVLIENTAGGDQAMARRVDGLERLWEVIDGTDVPYGLCLDTCHLHAAGEDMLEATRRLSRLAGGIDLLHLNDSRDEAGSGRDRHANLGEGEIDPVLLVAAVREAAAPVVIVETPGDAEGQASDIRWIRERL